MTTLAETQVSLSNVTFWIQNHWLYRVLVSLSAYFLSLLPVRGNRTTADLKSPLFLPSQTCQVTKSSTALSGKNRLQPLTCIVCLHLKLSFYHHVGAQHGRLHVIIQHDAQDQRTEVWKNSTKAHEDVWWQTTIWIPSDHTFQVQFATKSSTPDLGRLPPLCMYIGNPKLTGHLCLLHWYQTKQGWSVLSIQSNLV